MSNHAVHKVYPVAIAMTLRHLVAITLCHDVSEFKAHGNYIECHCNDIGRHGSMWSLQLCVIVMALPCYATLRPVVNPNSQNIWG